MPSSLLNDRFWIPLGASMLAASVTSAGIFAIRRFEAWGKQNTIYFISFAAGVLISASFLHIVPKSITMATRAPVYLLAGFFGLHLFNRFLNSYICERRPEGQYVIGLVPMLGIALHSFVDGIVYSITFTVSFFTGALAAIGMVLHEFPEGIITYLLLVRGGFNDKQSLILSLLAAAFTTPFGTLLSQPLISRISPSFLGSLLGLSAGALIYVGATHLLPQAEREQKRYSVLAFLAGVAVAVLIVLSES